MPISPLDGRDDYSVFLESLICYISKNFVGCSLCRPQYVASASVEGGMKVVAPQFSREPATNRASGKTGEDLKSELKFEMQTYSP